jgi:hypothetical protein
MSNKISSRTIELEKFPKVLKSSLYKNYWGEDPKKGQVRTYLVGFNGDKDTIYIRAGSRVELMRSLLLTILEFDNKDYIKGTAIYLSGEEGGKNEDRDEDEDAKVLLSAVKKVRKYEELSPKNRATKKFLRWKNPQRALIELSETMMEDGPVPPFVIPLDGTSMVLLSTKIFGEKKEGEKETYKIVKSDLELKNEKDLEILKSKKGEKGKKDSKKKSKESSSSDSEETKSTSGEEESSSDSDDTKSSDEEESDSESDGTKSSSEEDSSESEESEESEEESSEESPEEKKSKKSKKSKK